MEYKYFKRIKNADELKAKFKELANIYHPDKPTGNVVIMQEINAEYQNIKSKNEYHLMDLDEYAIKLAELAIKEYLRISSVTQIKIGSIYFKFLNYCEEQNVPPTEDSLKVIANFCGYKAQWIHYKLLELKQSKSHAHN